MQKPCREGLLKALAKAELKGLPKDEPKKKFAIQKSVANYKQFGISTDKIVSAFTEDYGLTAREAKSKITAYL